MINCERKGCKKKSWSHAYIEDGDNMYLVFLCMEHILELQKQQNDSTQE